jgi:hypothetical protein
MGRCGSWWDETWNPFSGCEPAEINARRLVSRSICFGLGVGRRYRTTSTFDNFRSGSRRYEPNDDFPEQRSS